MEGSQINLKSSKFKMRRISITEWRSGSGSSHGRFTAWSWSPHMNFSSAKKISFLFP